MKKLVDTVEGLVGKKLNSNQEKERTGDTAQPVPTTTSPFSQAQQSAFTWGCCVSWPRMECKNINSSDVK